MTNTVPVAPRLLLRSPADLIAATPYLLGFHPARSVVVIGFAGRQVAFTARGDLPDPGESPVEAARGLIDVVTRQRVDTVALLCYGPTADVDPLLRAVVNRAGRRGIVIREMLRIDDGRWWSYVCDDPACCPVEGTPIDLAASEVSALCTVEGLSAAPGREDLARLLAPVEGAARTAMSQATGRAKRRYARLLSTSSAGDWAGVVLAEGTAAIHAAIQRYEQGGVLDDDELAWLSLLLDAIAVRDVAWQAIAGTAHERRLWMDVSRRADPALVAAPASLLGFAAWRAGDGVLAGIALERALEADPAYAMARLLLRGLRQGVPPSALVDWPPPTPAVVLPDTYPRQPHRRRRRHPRRRSAGRRRPRGHRRQPH